MERHLRAVRKAADALLRCSGVGSEPRCYLCPFSLIKAIRRSVTGSRLAPASSVMGLKAGRRCCGLVVCALILGWALGADLIDDASALTDQPLTHAVERL